MALLDERAITIEKNRGPSHDGSIIHREPAGESNTVGVPALAGLIDVPPAKAGTPTKHITNTYPTHSITGVPMPPRILVLSASVGAGHLRAAEAVELALRQTRPDAHVE